MKKIVYRPFLTFLIIACLLGIFFLFRPFLIEIIIAAALVSIFYPWYEKLVKVLWGKKYLASFVMCLALLLVIIIPVTNLIVYTSQKTTAAYNSVNKIVKQADSFHYDVLEKLNIQGVNEGVIKNLVVDVTKEINDWLVSGATDIVKSTTSLVVSLGIIILTMLFFFVDGRKMAKKLITWSPLPNNYDLEIIRKFRKVSRVTLASIFITAFIQGLSGGLGFYIIGWPFIFTFIITGFLSLIPFLGASIFYFLAAIYLILNGQVGEAVFIILWWGIIVNGLDEILRAYIIKGKAEVNFIFVIFSVLGGIIWFGFWGVVIGPLIVSLAITIFHIYELEYKDKLDKI